ncbi:hypothetical protein NKH77_48655 [Streptomyces sp. M19]
MASVEAMVTRPFTPGQLEAVRPAASVDSDLYQLTWEPCRGLLFRGDPRTPQAATAAQGPWAVIGADPLDVAATLADAAGEPVGSYQGLPELIETLDAGEPAPHAVVLTVRDWQVEDDTTEEPSDPARRTAHHARTTTRRLLAWLQHWLAEPRPPTPGSSSSPTTPSPPTPTTPHPT